MLPAEEGLVGGVSAKHQGVLSVTTGLTSCDGVPGPLMPTQPAGKSTNPPHSATVSVVWTGAVSPELHVERVASWLCPPA